MSGGNIRITKLEAAQRQLRAAIEMWFVDGDPVPIHTLANSAHQIAHDLSMKQGLTETLFNWNGVKPGYRRQWINRMKADYNFFKHADKDSDSLSDLNPEVNGSLIMLTLVMLDRLGAESGRIERTFGLWQLLHHPNRFHAPPIDQVMSPGSITGLRALPKDDFRKAIELFIETTGRDPWAEAGQNSDNSLV